MSAFDTAVATLFRDPNLSVAATYTPKHASPLSIRVALRQPDAMSRLAEGLEVVSAGTQILVRVADVASPGAGDIVAIVGSTYTVQGVPRHQDEKRLVWVLDTHP